MAGADESTELPMKMFYNIASSEHIVAQSDNHLDNRNCPFQGRFKRQFLTLIFEQRETGTNNFAKYLHPLFSRTKKRRKRNHDFFTQNFFHLLLNKSSHFSFRKLSSAVHCVLCLSAKVHKIIDGAYMENQIGSYEFYLPSLSDITEQLEQIMVNCTLISSPAPNTGNAD